MKPETHQTVTTMLVHRKDKTAAPWWRSAVVCDLPGSLDTDNMSRIQALLPKIATLGFTAVLLRPADLRSQPALDALAHFITEAHTLGLRVIVRTFILEGEDNLTSLSSPPLLPLEHDTERMERRTKAVLQAGADGVDLGMVDERHGDADAAASARAFTEAVQAQLAEVTLSGDTAMLSAAISLEPRHLAQRHLTEEWFHHLRDDALINSPWDAREMAARINQTYADRDPLGHSAAWRYSLPRWSPSPLTRTSSDYGWAASQFVAEREVAMMLLTLALPGATYIPFLHVGGDVRVPEGENPHFDFIFEEGRTAQFQSRIAQEAVSLRHRLGLGENTLAWVNGLDWAPDTALVMLSGTIMVILNTGDTSVVVPSEHRLAIASDPYPPGSANGTEIGPNTCAWFHTAPLQPVNPVAHR